MTGIDVVKDIRNLFSDESRWTKGVYARDDEDYGVHYTDENACSWCLIGALVVYSDKYSEASKQAYDMIREHISIPLRDFNDDIDIEHSDMINMLDTVIEQNKSEMKNDNSKN